MNEVLSLKRNAKVNKLVGPKFKEIRKKKHVSLKELAQKTGVTSTSALSRWERGEEGLPVEIFDKLLTSLNISYNEIITNEIEIKQVIMKVEFLYQENKIQELKDYTNKLLDTYYRENDNYLRSEYLIRAATAANYYFWT